MSLGYVLIKGIELDDAIDYMRSKSLRIDRLVEMGGDYKFIINYDNPNFNYKMVSAEPGVEYYYFDYRSPVEKEPILLLNNMLVGENNFRPGKNIVSPQDQGFAINAKIERYKTLMGLLIEYSKIPTIGSNPAENAKFSAMRGELLQKMEPDVTYYDVEFPQQVKASISELKELIHRLSLRPGVGFERPVPIHTGEVDTKGVKHKLYAPTRDFAPSANLPPLTHSSNYRPPPANYNLPNVPTTHSAAPYEPRPSADVSAPAVYSSENLPADNQKEPELGFPYNVPAQYSSDNVPAPPPLPDLSQLMPLEKKPYRIIEPQVKTVKKAPEKRAKTIQEELAERAASKEGLKSLLKPKKELSAEERELREISIISPVLQDIAKAAVNKAKAAEKILELETRREKRDREFRQRLQDESERRQRLQDESERRAEATLAKRAAKAAKPIGKGYSLKRIVTTDNLTKSFKHKYDPAKFALKIKKEISKNVLLW